MAAEPRRLVPIGGEPYEAALVAATADGVLTFRDKEQTRTVPAADLVRWGVPAEPGQSPLILLAGGGLLVADVLKCDEEQLTVDSALLGKLAIPLEQVSVLVLHPPLDRTYRDEFLSRLLAREAKQDLVILDNGDELLGTLLAIAPDEVEFEAAVGKLKLSTDRILALAFDPSLVNAPKSQGQRMTVGFSDGSRVVARSMTISSDTAELALAGGQNVRCPLAEIVFLQTSGGRAEYLSDLKPAGYKHVPFLQLAWPYKPDRNVLGTFLRSQRQLYLKGVGMHSASRLTFPLDGRHKRFCAEVAVDDRAGLRGSVVFRVFVDAQQKYASPVVRGGDSPLAVSVDLPEGAQSLSLIVDFADRGDELDYASWLDARLER